MRTIWDGKGELRDTEAYFTTNDGLIVGRPYVRRRVYNYLLRRWGQPALVQRVLCETVDKDEWLRVRNRMLVAAVCRDAERLIDAGLLIEGADGSR